MKKIMIIITIILSVLLVGGYVLLDNIFPKAEPINYPIIDDVNRITISQNKLDSVNVEYSDYETLLQLIDNAKPTRKMSVNDYPTVETYYVVEIDTNEREYRYFICDENGQLYIESPYEGIYI